MLVAPGRITEREAGCGRALLNERWASRRIQRAQRGKRDRPRPHEAHPRGRGMDGEGAEEAGMGQSMMAQRQQNDLEIHRPKTGRPGLGADKERLRFVGDAMKNRLEFAAVGVEPKVEKGAAPQLLEENRVSPRACDPERKAMGFVEVEHERVRQHAADRARVDIAAFGRAAPGPQPVPVRVEFHRDSKLHRIPSTRSPASRNGTQSGPRPGLVKDEAGTMPFRNGTARAETAGWRRLRASPEIGPPVQNRHIHGLGPGTQNARSRFTPTLRAALTIDAQVSSDKGTPLLARLARAARSGSPGVMTVSPGMAFASRSQSR